MSTEVSFAQVLEAVDSLPLAEQEALEDILRRRIIEGRRAEIAADIREARREFQKGRCQPVTVAELLAELKS
jgi:hypothetical protein